LFLQNSTLRINFRPLNKDILDRVRLIKTMATQKIKILLALGVTSLINFDSWLSSIVT